MEAPAEPPELASSRSFLDLTKILSLVFGILWALAAVAEIALAMTNPACQVLIGCETDAYVIAAPLLLFAVFDLLTRFMIVPQLRAALDAGQFQTVKEKSFLWALLNLLLGGVIVGILLLVLHLKMEPLITWQQGQGGVAQAPVVQQAPYPQSGQAPAQYPGAQGQPYASAPMAGPQGPYASPPQNYPAAQPYPTAPAAPPAQSYAAPPAYAPSPAPSPPPQAAPSSPPTFATYNPNPTPNPGPTPAPTPGAPSCRSCGKPTTWVAPYGRYYCYGCAQYA